MKAFLKALPIPIAGVMLGLFALGNLLQSYSESVRLVLGVIAFVIWVLLVLKVIFCFKGVCEGMKDPAVATVAATFPMGTMLLAVYAKPYLGDVTRFLWYAAILIHIALILYITKAFILKFDLPKIHASYFIVYCGIAVASLTAPAYGAAATIGTWAFWFAFVSVIALFVPVTMRYVKLPYKVDPPKPLICIYAAPVSLCLAAYCTAVEPKSSALLLFMLAWSQLLFVFVLTRLPALLELHFFPSYAAFTFPFAITAIAAKQSMAILGKMGISIPGHAVLVQVEMYMITLNSPL